MNPPFEKPEYPSPSDPVKLTPEQIQADTQRLRTEQVLLIAEDDLRQRIIEEVPEIRSDVKRMEAAIYELVEAERAKLPPTHGCGFVVLYPDKWGKYHGKGGIGTKRYNVIARPSTDDHGQKILEVTLFPI